MDDNIKNKDAIAEYISSANSIKSIIMSVSTDEFYEEISEMSIFDSDFINIVSKYSEDLRDMSIMLSTHVEDIKKILYSMSEYNVYLTDIKELDEEG